MSRNTDRELGHGHESDGIEEYDNPLPDWWVGMFLVCIVWGIAYATDFHFISHHSQKGYYEEEIADAKVRWPDLNKAVGQSKDPAVLEEGKAAFEKNCVACHTPAMTGLIGPNLIDDQWINGSSYEAIVKTITEGVSAKGMPTWGPVLGPKVVGAAASYILAKNEGEAGRAKTTAVGAYANGGASNPGPGGATPPATPPAAPAAPATPGAAPGAAPATPGAVAPTTPPAPGAPPAPAAPTAPAAPPAPK